MTFTWLFVVFNKSFDTVSNDFVKWSTPFMIICLCSHGRHYRLSLVRKGLLIIFSLRVLLNLDWVYCSVALMSLRYQSYKSVLYVRCVQTLRPTENWPLTMRYSSSSTQISPLSPVPVWHETFSNSPNAEDENHFTRWPLRPRLLTAREWMYNLPRDNYDTGLSTLYSFPDEVLLWRHFKVLFETVRLLNKILRMMNKFKTRETYRI